MIVYFYQLDQTDSAKSLEVNIKYFESLENTLIKLNQIYSQKLGEEIEEVYNQYGQKIPLTYRVQKTGLKVYYRLSN